MGITYTETHKRFEEERIEERRTKTNKQVHNTANYYRDHYCSSFDYLHVEREGISLEKENMTYEQIFNLGVQAGIKMMENKIERQCERGKPILANGNLYWLKDARQNLIDIMDDLEADSE